jgi:hypothetical protein
MDWSNFGKEAWSKRKKSEIEDELKNFENICLYALYGETVFSFDDIGAIIKEGYSGLGYPFAFKVELQEVLEVLLRAEGVDNDYLLVDQLNGIFACRDSVGIAEGPVLAANQAREQLHMLAVHTLFHTPLVRPDLDPKLRFPFYQIAMKRARKARQNAEKAYGKAPIKERAFPKSGILAQQAVEDALRFNQLIFSEEGMPESEVAFLWRQWWSSLGRGIEEYDRFVSGR